jgi:hypothetical protein
MRCIVHAAVFVIVLLLSTHQAAFAGQATGRITSFALRSAILNEERTFQVFIPPESGPGTKVICVLDGQAHFTTVVDALTALGQNRHLVIGIGNIWLRDRDRGVAILQRPRSHVGRPFGGEGWACVCAEVAAS